MGGRFDATNVIDVPEAAAIMSISLDHTAILGDTLEKIAFEKAGIVKEGGRLVLYSGPGPGGGPGADPDLPRAPGGAVSSRICAQVQELESVHRKAPELASGGHLLGAIPGGRPFLGEHQVKNAVTALDGGGGRCKGRGWACRPRRPLPGGLTRLSSPPGWK